MERLKRKTIKRYHIRMASLMLLADLGGFGLTGISVTLLNYSLHLFVLRITDAKYLVIALLCLALFMSSRLYPGVGINPADEIRLVTHFISTGFMLGIVFWYLIQPEWRLNYAALLVAWGCSLLLVLLSRWSVRILSAQLGLWGEPVVVVGKGPRIQQLSQYFIQRRRLGYVPVLAVAGSAGRPAITSPVPIIDLNDLAGYADDYFSKADIQTALVDISTIANVIEPGASHSLFRLFRKVIFISDVDRLEGAVLNVRDFEGLIGVEARKSVIGPTSKAIKRGLDLVIASVGGLLALPFLLALAAWIKLDSAGPVIYTQDRIGRGGCRIKVYKFRSMQTDADHALSECLAHDQAAMAEWARTQKLRNDPRLTHIGRVMRQFSLDELPQLWNILKGDMSLVGPRPMMPGQEDLYGPSLPLYCRVRPGLSGLWQVSGRNQTTFGERAKFDYYYVHNWSIWLDLYILLRTVWVVLSRDGAY